ncbi:MAG: DUF4301 family protein [Deltaproteobacteria bacterium]|nr:DUF4301 family protein [Deltaproteobacteria bacterium]
MKFFDQKDILQIKSLGIAPEKASAQLSLFKKGSGLLDLVRPATTGDGIIVLPEEAVKNYAAFYESKIPVLKPLKFVPASGAATRMWKALSALRAAVEKEGLVVLRMKAGEGDKDAISVIEFFENLEKFALCEALAKECEKAGKNLAGLLEFGNYSQIYNILFDPKGLNLKNLAKGLIPFHLYKNGPKTAFEEHLYEAAGYVRDSKGVCRLHFTVPKDQQHDFAALFEKAGKELEKELGVKFEVEFSIQDTHTDTLAANEDFSPFRTPAGDLFFRPAGHGALISNLDRIDASPVFLANIDNVVPDKAKGERILWKKALAGLLVDLKEKIEQHLEILEKNPEKVPEVLAFAQKTLLIFPPSGLDGKKNAEFLQKALNRPIRVCGMVKNLGDPGGAPFWVRETDGRLTLQIVESAQVRQDHPEQAEIFRSSTHFNPVDVVAWVFDRHGKKFNLSDFVDEHAVFISKKSQDGKNLLALELPGLWNGAMSDWTTLFVEVPMCEYNPVKSINDLLHPSHFGLSADCS